MNEHLKPIFCVLLPWLEKSGIDYWVYGGVSIAAFVGEFKRENKDVDVFVKDADFEKVKIILEDLCRKENFKLDYHKPEKSNRRPKIDISIERRKRFSVIPVYWKDDLIEFRYPENNGGNEEYSGQILEKVERNIAGFRFFTPQDRYIKEIFIKHMKARPDKTEKSEYRKDAKAILSLKELTKLGM